MAHGLAARWQSRRWLRALCLLAGVALASVAGLELSYRWILRGLPILPTPMAVPRKEALDYAWRSLGGAGAIRGEVLYPWMFGRVWNLDHLAPSLKAAHYVAQFHILTLQDEQRISSINGLRGSIRERVLIVWLSRHWSVEQLVGWTYTATVLPTAQRAKEAR